MSEFHFPFRLVAAFSDGARLYFEGLTESAARAEMEAAQAVHGDLTWFDGVTDVSYEHGRYYTTIPGPPQIAVIDLTGKETEK